MNRILLVGGGGFIGHHLAADLWLHGKQVYVLDDFCVNNLLYHLGNAQYERFLLERFRRLNASCKKIYRYDARDYHLVSKAVEDCKPDVIVHLAAVSHANKSNKDPHNTFDHSLRTLENALDAARSIPVKQFVYFSSSMVYGDFGGTSVNELTSSLKPKGVYGVLKLSGEMMVKSYNEVFGLPYTIIRPSALYGPRCVSRRVLQVFIEKLEAGEPLSVQGDGNDRLDFTYIEDLVLGVGLCIGNKKALQEEFNITYGRGRSLQEAIEILGKYYKNLTVEYKVRDRLMPVRGSLEIDKAREYLGYEPQFPLEKGLDSYVRWYREKC